ncbi:MAG: BofC C-terminal domain-containing protein [Lachnospira sp.]|nr:BofC C-terminal domain-containing protein [Lachnospira sp.]
MKFNREKNRLIVNIICFGICAALMVTVVVLCLVATFKKEDNSGREPQTRAASMNETYDANKQEEKQTGTKEDLVLVKSYYLIEENGKISIYEVREGENVFYDYAQVERALMTEETKEQLKKGLFLNTEAELYEFLQTYSS